MKKPRLFKKKQAKTADAPNRITNETVAEHRERILAGGRRFKYPVQYARHRLVINAIIIGVTALILVICLVWWQLYPLQNTSTFFYRITRVVPLPVATVDGAPVRYSDYLVGFRSQEHYTIHIEGTDLYQKEYKQQLDFFKRRALDNAIADTYAAKVAQERDITISDKQVDEALKRQRKARDGEISKEAYDASVLDHYNLTPEETREMTERSLLRQEVAYNIDTIAAKQRDQVVEKLKKEKDFDKVAASIPAKDNAKVQSGVTPLVPSSNQDGGLAEMAAKLDVGKASEVFRSTNGDGYYIVKPLEKDNNGRVSYAYLKIPLTVFDSQLQKLKDEQRISEYINIPEVNTSLKVQ